MPSTEELCKSSSLDDCGFLYGPTHAGCNTRLPLTIIPYNTYSPQSPVEEAGERDSHTLCRLAAILLGSGRSGSGRSVRSTSSASLTFGGHELHHPLQSSPCVSCERSRRPDVLSGVGGGGGGCGAWRSSCASLASSGATAGRGKGQRALVIGLRHRLRAGAVSGGGSRWPGRAIGRKRFAGGHSRGQSWEELESANSRCPTTSASPSTPPASSEPVELLAAHRGEAGALHAGRLAPEYSMRLELETPLSAVYGGGTSCAESHGRSLPPMCTWRCPS